MILLEILQLLEKIMDIADPPEILQKEINVLEVDNLWNELSSRYSVSEETQILLNYVEDPDLKYIMTLGLERLDNQIKLLEEQFEDYAIPSPERNRSIVMSVTKPETFSDKYIFERVFSGIQAFLDIHIDSFTKTPSPRLREIFKEFLLEEIKIYDRIYEYGKLKNWILEPPAFRT